ncbi:MAG: hypothetical protein CM1200mP37_1970 [Chloroflexota bacterium]|nr:MAG: hypothetical protein CM1200mP37_1970 [Chloroflexota bacterium]
MKLLQKQYEKDPKNAELYTDRGNTYVFSSRYSEAINDFDMAISLIDNRPELYADRGLVHLLLENYANAESDFSNALALSPQNHIYYTRRGKS